MALDAALIAMDRACGSGSVVQDPDILATYAIDESEAAPCTPAAVVRVRNTQQVSAVMKAAFEHGVPVTPRGGGTGRVGGAVPVQGGIALLFEKMTELKNVDTTDGLAVVEPGVVTGHLHEKVEELGLLYPPDPNSLGACVIGGNIATNAGGPRAFKYGVTREYVLGMEVVLADGTILQLGRRTKKGVTGYDLTALMVGSEGTLGLVTEATLQLVPKPEGIATLLAFLPDDASIARAIKATRISSLRPRCIELLDTLALEIVKADAGLATPDNARAMLLVELDGGRGVLDSELERCGNALTEAGALEVLVAQDVEKRERLWSARREMSRSLRKRAQYKLAEDVVVPCSRIADLLATCRDLSNRHNVVMPTYGHAGDGNLHVNFLWNSPEEKSRVDRAVRNLFEATVALGGTLSGEHGIGIMKAPFLPLEQSPALIAVQERIKNVFDPRGVLNPGKIFPSSAKRFHGAC